MLLTLQSEFLSTDEEGEYMACPQNKIDSNSTGLAIAQEECPNILPDAVASSGDQAGGVWFGQEPNSYPDFGSTVSTVSRQPLDPSRQNKKGSVTTVDATAGFSTDVTKNNITRLMQGAFFADAREKFSTVPMNAAKINAASVTGSSKTYTYGTGLLPLNRVGLLVLAEGYNVLANNGLRKIASATATTAVVAETIVDEASAPANARLTAVGIEFASGDAVLTVVGGRPVLTVTAGTLNNLGLIEGEWVFLGGDTAGTQLGANTGYARIFSIAAKSITFDDTTFTPVANPGTGIAFRMFFGTVIKNENTAALIKRRTYQLERTLGQTAAGDTQAEYVIGSTLNQFTLNIPNSDKLTADFNFISNDSQYRDGSVGQPLKPGTRFAGFGEAAINTSSDLYRFKVALLSTVTSNPTGLFGFASEGSIAIDNGVSPLKALGRLGAFDASTGNFGVTGSVTAYFSSIDAVRAVRANADVGMSAIFAAQNAGQIFDVPLVSLGNGRAQVELNQPIMLPLETSGAQNRLGYTMMYVNFAYLPNSAMPII